MPRYEVSNDRLGILHGITQNDPAPDAPATKEPRHRSKRHRSPKPSSSAPTDGPPGSSPHLKKFRFKKKHRREHREDSERTSSKKRPKPTYHEPLNDNPEAYDDTYIPNAASWQHNPDPDAAFRESLFDAMADDEGAAFWEGVYGQPIHVYSRPEVKDERGELDKLTDEEYAKFVREKMWEKSHQHILEERERRQKEGEKRRKKDKEEKEAFEREQGEERRKEKLRRERRHVDNAAKRWKEYSAAWEQQAKGGDVEAIPWPVISGQVENVTKEAVREFVLASAERGQAFLDMLKVERVRWHPDKAQQRWGKAGLRKLEMEAITTAFQAIDGIWNERKDDKGHSS